MLLEVDDHSLRETRRRPGGALHAVAFQVALLVMVCACRTYDTIYTDEPGSQCVKPRTLCSGVCTDPSSDRANCGGCGQTCATNELCVSAQCVACPANEVACGATSGAFCVNTLNDDQNCGTCGNVCGHGTKCENGSCACPLTTCGADCVDTTSDVNHCGSCDVVCPAGAANELAVCVQSSCSATCIAPFADCDGQGANGCEADLMTDAQHCGACGHACLGGTCSSGLCGVTTYGTGSQLGALAVDATSVYWADRSTSTGGIYSAPIAGGTATKIYDDNVVTELGADGSLLVWLELNDRIQSGPLGGGTSSVVANASGILSVAFAGGYVYYTTSSSVVARAPDDASAAPVTISSGNSSAAIAVDATNVYFADGAGDVYDAPVGGQGVTATLFAPGVGAMTLAVDSSRVYWTDSSGAIASQPKGGTTPTKLAPSQSVVSNLATDGTSLYWATATGDIVRMPVTGGTAVVVAPAQPGPTLVAVDATRVYWVSSTVVRSTSK